MMEKQRSQECYSITIKIIVINKQKDWAIIKIRMLQQTLIKIKQKGNQPISKILNQKFPNFKIKSYQRMINKELIIKKKAKKNKK